MLPLSGVKPRVTKGTQNVAERAATTWSPASARELPMPAANPCTPVTIGTSASKSVRIMR